ncbi:MAG: DUF1559 domain-containing protein [Planctomycetes bacterium]|nr:DUF1559 domain-containing protein [Planctomycetota bacterium]
MQPSSAVLQPLCRGKNDSRVYRGFTLVEMLIVIAIIGILIALLLPAIQMTRERSRDVQCKNNLKQTALGFNLYADGNGGFPNRQSLTTALTSGHGWGVRMLPYIGEHALFEKFNFKFSWFDPENKAVTMTPVPTYMCPAAPSGSVRVMDLAKSSPTTTTSTGYAGDYVVFHQLLFTGTGVTCTGCTTAAPKDVNSVTRLNKIKDGLSNTILLAEQAGRPTYYIGRTAQASNTSMTNPKFWGCWAAYQSVQAQGWNAALPPAAGGIFTMNRSNSQGVYSFHNGGGNFGLCDGSVRLISEEIDIKIMMALYTADGGESIGTY